jgi:hypothetical protein
MSSQDYLGTWVNGTRHAVGTSKFAGQTRNRKLADGSIMQVTYGFNEIGKSGLVATISEIIDKNRLPDEIQIHEKHQYFGIQKIDIVDQILTTTAAENQWQEEKSS